MKQKLVLISLLLVAAFPALFGQTLQVGMRWEYLTFPFIVINPNEPVGIASLEITGDTLIQGTSYFKLETDLYPCNYEPTTLIREEGSRVYHHYEGEDYLLYDYSLNPGDTLWQTYWNFSDFTPDILIMPYPLYVIDTASVWLGGVWRKVQTINYNLGTDTLPIWSDIGGFFIDGFGSNYFYYPVNTLCEFVACLRAVYWPNGDSTLVDSLTNCFIIDNTSEKEVSQALSIAPNPAEEVLYIQARRPLSPEAPVAVYDLNGRPLYHGTFAEAQKGIPVATWPAGVYVAVVWEGERPSMVRVVVR